MASNCCLNDSKLFPLLLLEEDEEDESEGDGVVPELELLDEDDDSELDEDEELSPVLSIKTILIKITINLFTIRI